MGCCGHPEELHRVPGSVGLCYGRHRDGSWCPCVAEVETRRRQTQDEAHRVARGNARPSQGS